MTTNDAAAAPTPTERDGLDPSTRAQDDLFRHVNGLWFDSHVIPDDRASDGTFRKLFDEAEENVKNLIVAASGQAEAGSEEAAKISAVYDSFMDTDLIEEVGISALDLDVNLVRAASNHDDLAAVIGALQRSGVAGLVAPFVDVDAADPTRYVVYLEQSGLGLPDEAYYREETHAKVREAYVGHIERMLNLAGLVPAGEAAEAAEKIFELETRLASFHWDNVRSRDAEATHNPATAADLAKTAAGFNWQQWADGLGGADALAEVVIRQPDFITNFASCWERTSLEEWKLFLFWKIVHSRAPFLNEALVEENFDFSGRTLTGARALRDRWKRAVGLVQGVLGEAVGKLYVDKHFPPSHKQAMDVLVADLISAYRDSITSLDWMSEDTRKRALEKLDSFTPKIGYPVRWRDYSTLVTRADDLIGNVRAANAFESDYELAKLGRAIDRDEWFMTPQTVNAYYNPTMNEIVFPAAILQPPFFDAEANAAANYGAIGAVIGHEIGHGFDDQGSKYDGEGRLNDWWTEQDRIEFEARTKKLIDQYSQLSPSQLGDDHKVNGALTIGENIGDVGGLGIAVKAYRIAAAREGKEVTNEQLREFFLAWARAWRNKARDEEVIRRLAIDPHSPDEIRCNGVVRNLDEFAQAFELSPSDGLWLDEDERVRIW